MREPQDFSPWWLTAPFCLADRLRFSGQKGDVPRLQPERNSPLRSALRIALRFFGQDGVFPQLQLVWKMRQQGAKRVGATKEHCP